MLHDYVQPFVPSFNSLIIFFFVVYIPLYIFSVTFFGRRTRKSPFVFPSLLTGTGTSLSEKRQRDAVLRQYFNPKRVPARVDVIVVGSGLGGLTTAALLSRSGTRALVLERRSAAGGLQGEENCQVEFEMEQHWGGMAPGAIPRMVLDQVTNAHVHWAPVEADFDNVCVLRDGAFLHRLAVTKGVDVFRERLLEAFPNEAGAIRRYFHLLNSAAQSWWHPMWAKLFPLQLVRLFDLLGVFRFFSSFFRLSQRSLQEVLDEVTSCEELKTLLAHATLARGVSPQHESFVAHAFRSQQTLETGAFYPQGGYEELAFRMGSLIEAAKGKILVNAAVVELLTDGRRVTGVRVVTDNKAVDVFARTVILAEGAGAATRLLPAELREKSAGWLRSCEALLQAPNPTPARFHLHLWLSEDVANLRSQNVFLCFKEAGRSDGQALEEWLERSASEASRRLPPFVVLSVPSAKDPVWLQREGGANSLLIVSFAGSPSWAPELRSDLALRQNLIDGLWRHLCRVRPTLEAAKVTRALVRVEEELLSLSDCPARFEPALQIRLRPNCGPRGLLLTGSDLVTDGPCGEVHGALLCASYHLNRGLTGELAKMAVGAISKRAYRIWK